MQDNFHGRTLLHVNYHVIVLNVDQHVKFDAMARYSKEHKERSRAAIVTSAAGLFRKHGYKGVGIDDLCADAGLTRGTFYTHFQSKADLFKEVMKGPHDMVRRLSERKSKSPRALLSAGVKVFRDYLHQSNRRGVLGGCSLAALAMDTVRGDTASQSAYAHAVEQIVTELQRENDLTRGCAQAALALCIGGLLIGSACGESNVGDQVARSAGKNVEELLNRSGFIGDSKS